MTPKCECSLRTKLAGDGCHICNPEYWADMLAADDDTPKDLPDNVKTEDDE